MEKLRIDIGTSTGHYEGIYIDIMSFPPNCPDVENVDKLPQKR